MHDVGLVPDAQTGMPNADGTERDLATTALILGVAGFAWFLWGRAAPPAGWSVPLELGAAAGLAVAVAGGVLARRLRAGRSAMDDAGARRAYWRVVAIEAAAICLGAGALAVAGQAAYIPAWILLTVGAHFIPLARLFRNARLTVAGLLLIAVAAAGAAAGITGAALPSAVAGGGGGLVCVGFAAACLYRARAAHLAAATGRVRPSWLAGWTRQPPQES